MNETKQRIRAYKAALPALRERVIAVALLLAMSMAMMTSASFAWLTISRRPEVTGVNTTVAANGNLEIALVSPDGSQPGESKVGDSSAAEGQTVTGSNITWGNLVNLSDSSYGLSNIVLRPALLGNTSNLLEQPLKGVDYGKDGRVELYYNEDFQFTNWVEPANGLDGYFMYNEVPQYGVRAISTVEFTYVNNSYYQFTQLMKVVSSLQESVKSDYDAMIANRGYINALAGLIGDFMTDKLNERNGTTDVGGYMEDVYNLMVEFEGIVDSFKDVIVALANAQVYNKYGPEEYSTYTYTRETFFAASTSELAANGVVIDCLDDYLTIEKTLNEVLYGKDPAVDDCIADYYTRVANDRNATVQFSEIQSIINKMVDINSCQIILLNGTKYSVGSIGMSAALDILGETIDAKITKGLLKDFEQLSGCKMVAEDVAVTATFIFPVTMTAETITTTAVAPYKIDADITSTEEVAAANKGDFTGVAQDTYGMALDLWVRTNALDSYLVLEGNVLTQTDTIRATGTDMNGSVVELYTVTITTAVTGEDGTQEEVSEDVAVYKLTGEDNTETWYNATTHGTIYNEDGTAPEGQTISTPMERYTDVVTVIGYEGENRIWQDNVLMDTDSTTQGSGSCYVFYAEDPAQQENSLRLLSNLRVAFIDSDEESVTYGKLIAMAQLDIENRYEASGKVTVPLKLVDDGSTYLTKTEEGLAIMELEQNKATRLSAIVYLDGRNISNADVLAANDIQGQLNIQFGSSTPLSAISDEDLELATRSVSAVSKKATDAEFGTSNTPITFSYDEASDTNPMTVDVKLTVVGDRPTNVTAFFMRKVNETQGSREASFSLTESQTEDGVWTGSFTFTAPGQYVLRTVQLDGVDYDLPADNYPQVTVEGFSINDVAVSRDGALVQNQATTIMTGDRNVSMDLALKFATNQTKLPGSVRLQFLKDDGTQVTANMTYNATTTTWSGRANFTSSGVYTLKYVIMDGEYTELDPQYQKELTIYMGMTVRIADGGGLRDETYTGESYSVPMYVDIYDDTGAEIRYLTGVKLQYSRSGSNVDGMNPDMKWDAAEGCYTGNLQVPGPGVYTFNSVVVGGNALRNTVNTPPVFTCISPEPPVYVDAEPMEGMDYLLSTGTNTYNVGVRFAHAEGATVTAVLYDADTGSTHRVSATPAGSVVENGVEVSSFNFELPKTNGYQIGDWTITSLELANVYDADSKFYDSANPMVMDMTGSDDDLHVKVVSVDVRIDGTDETLDGGLFMGTATSQQNIKIHVMDQNGDALDSNYVDIANVNMRYQYKNGSSEEHGHYTSDAEADLPNIDIQPTGDDGRTFTMAAMTFAYAGQYEAYSMTFDVLDVANGNVVAQSFDFTSSERASSRNGIPVLDMPVYILKTDAPSVTIAAVTPGGSYSADTNTSGTVVDTAKGENAQQGTGCNSGTTYYDYTWTMNSAHKSGFTSSISADGLSATVYFKCLHVDGETYDGGSRVASAANQRYHTYISDAGYGNPSVTLTLNDISGFTSATLNFSDNTHIYSAVTYSSSGLNGIWETTGGGTAYSWTSGGTNATRYIGYSWSQKDRWSDSINATGQKTPAGTITANTLDVVYNGATYAFTIDPVTINNPH